MPIFVPFAFSSKIEVLRLAIYDAKIAITIYSTWIMAEALNRQTSWQTVDDGTKIANELMSKLGISESDLIAGAYMDLIERKENAAI